MNNFQLKRNDWTLGETMYKKENLKKNVLLLFYFVLLLLLVVVVDFSF